MDGILELETEEQFEALGKCFPDAVAIQKTDWGNIWMLVFDGNRAPDVKVQFEACHDDEAAWPES